MSRILKQAILWHRHMSVCACLFFAMWFVSGIVMTYAGMPELQGMVKG
jgi:hypothetical protein